MASTPNLAGMNKLSIWKQLQDFRIHKRRSRAMEPIAESLSPRDIADVVSYYSALPVFPDPQDNRVFPRESPDAGHAAVRRVWLRLEMASAAFRHASRVMGRWLIVLESHRS